MYIKYHFNTSLFFLSQQFHIKLSVLYFCKHFHQLYQCKETVKKITPISKVIFAHLKDPLRHDLHLVLLLFFLHKNGTFF